MAAALQEVARPARVPSISDAMARVVFWYRVTKGGIPALGYARRSVIGRVIDEGPGAAHRAGVPAPTWIDPEVERIDRLIASLPEDLREALVADQSNRSIKEICARLKCMPRDFHWRRACAYGVLAGLLTR